MVATVSDVVLLMTGSPTAALSYSIFGHTVTHAAIAQQLDFAQEYYDGDFFDASVLANKEDKVDKIIILDTAVCIMGSQVMGALMVSGFSYSAFEHSLNASNFPDIVKNALMQWAAQRDRFIRQLNTEVDTDNDTNMGPDYWSGGLDNFDQDSLPNPLYNDEIIRS